MTTVFTKYDESLGKNFNLHYDRLHIVAQLEEFIELGAVDENGECDEYPIGTNDYGAEITLEDRNADIARMKEIIHLFRERDENEADDDLDEFLVGLINAHPTKKNGSFAKGRVNNVSQFDAFGIYWEDSYGTYTPALRVRSTGDYDCSLLVESYVVKY